MKIGYGTYGMPDEDVFDALPRLKAMGYEAVEININDDWPTAPLKLDGDTRKKLVDALQQEGFPPPVLMNGLAVCALDMIGLRQHHDRYCGASEFANGEDGGWVGFQSGGEFQW